MAASKLALEDAQAIQLPYRHYGYFQPDKPRALGLKFTAKTGERLTFTITKKAGSNFALYADLFKISDQNSPLLSADTTNLQFSFDVEETNSYVLRLQPELFRTGEYDFSISTGPSLAFPVSGNKARIGSFWGDDRDGGNRSHEGVDIFAAKGTPAIAVADGYVTGVGDGGIGGKTIWLRPAEKNYTVYYAHLDKQLVTQGQFVKKGDTVGAVGNTGNAKHTPAHLHFGIYTYGGAVNPLSFVSKTVKAAEKVSAKDLTGYLKLNKAYKAIDAFAGINTVLIPVAVTSKGYLAEMPGGKIILAPFSDVKTFKTSKQEAVVTSFKVNLKKS